MLPRSPNLWVLYRTDSIQKHQMGIIANKMQQIKQEQKANDQNERVTVDRTETETTSLLQWSEMTACPFQVSDQMERVTVDRTLRQGLSAYSNGVN
jgi:hypothetical protein